MTHGRSQVPYQGAAHHRSGLPPLSRRGKLLAAAGIALVATAAFNRYAARRTERRNPPKGRFIDIEGVRLHYIEKGAGTPVLLIHGNVVEAGDFVHSGVFDLLARQYRVISFDRPGMGFSERPHGKVWTPAAQASLLRRACDRLGIEQPVVVGHSWGAMVATAFALDHPEAVRGLVLLSGYYYPTMRADVALSLAPAIPVIGDVLRYTVSPLLGRALMPAVIKAMFSPCPVPSRFDDNFPAGLSVRPGQIRASSQDAASMIPAAMAMRDRYAELAMPVAIMAGAGDKVADPDRQSARLHRALPRSMLRVIPDAGHMVHYAAPAEVAALVRAVSSQDGEAGRPHVADAGAAVGEASPLPASVSGKPARERSAASP